MAKGGRKHIQHLSMKNEPIGLIWSTMYRRGNGADGPEYDCFDSRNL